MANTKVYLTVSGVEHDLLSEYGLIMSSIDIEAPAPKLFTADIPHGDGEIDKTDYFGTVKYYNRAVTVTFSISHGVSASAVYGQFLTGFNGQMVKLRTTLDDNYYRGRISSVSKLTRSNRVWGFSIILDAAPYRYNGIGEVVGL